MAALQLSVQRVRQAARRHLGLKSARGPRPLSNAALARFYEAIDSTQNITHQIMLRLLFYMGIR